MIRNWLYAVLALGVSFASKPAAAGQHFSYTVIHFPGAIATYGVGVNVSGVVLGRYCFSSGLCGGFTWQSGSFQTIAGPEGQSTLPAAINNAGTIAGYYLNETEAVGFVLQAGAFHIAALAGFNVFMNGLNSNGDAVGYATQVLGSESYTVTYHNGVFTWTATSVPMNYIAVNDSLSIVGALRLCQDGFCESQALLQDTAGTHLLSNKNFANSIGVGINDAGMALGFLSRPDGPNRSVIITGDQITSCSYPNLVSSTGNAINQSGDIVGDARIPPLGPDMAYVRDHQGA